METLIHFLCLSVTSHVTEYSSTHWSAGPSTYTQCIVSCPGCHGTGDKTTLHGQSESPPAFSVVSFPARLFCNGDLGHRTISV